MMAAASSGPDWRERLRPLGPFVLKQLFLYAISCLLVYLFPTIHNILLFSFLGLLNQLVSPESKVVAATSAAAITTPVNLQYFAWEALYALVVYIVVVVPAVYVFKHSFLKRYLATGDERAVVERLRIRALTLRWSAVGSVLLIIMLLIIGLLIFTSADRLGFDSAAAASAPSPAEQAKATADEPDGGKPDAKAGAPSADGDVLDDKLVIAVVVSSVTTRIAAALMLVFLVSILSNLYRYHMRLATFSDGRADALELLTVMGAKSPANLRKLANVLAGDKVPFTETRSPVGEVAAAMGPAMAKAKELGGKVAGVNVRPNGEQG